MQFLLLRHGTLAARWILTDQRVRDAERRWRETGDALDEAAFVAELVRTGRLSANAMHLIVYCNHPLANALGTKPTPSSLRGWLDGLGAWGKVAFVVAAVGAAQVSAPNLTNSGIDPQEILRACRAHLSRENSDHSGVRTLTLRLGEFVELHSADLSLSERFAASACVGAGSAAVVTAEGHSLAKIKTLAIQTMSDAFCSFLALSESADHCAAKARTELAQSLPDLHSAMRGVLNGASSELIRWAAHSSGYTGPSHW